MIGKAILHYKILERLGNGGMGVVYKAEDTKLQRIVALKLLPTELTRDPEAKGRLIREAQAASALQHHNICTIHEIGETDDGEMFFCMDYYEGVTLKERLSRLQAKNKLPMSASEALDIGIQIAQGLAKAHEKGIIHRDIKPANIMITNEGVVKILDFGVAKQSGKSRLTQTGKTIGTIAYVSPEQAEGKNVDVRTDIWSLGVVMYEMFTAKLPFEHEHDAAIIYAILDKEPSVPSQSGSPVPEILDKVILKCLQKKPADRYQSAEELLSDLIEIRKRISGKELLSSSKESKTIRAKKFITKKWKYSLAVAFLILIVGGIFLLPQLKQKHKPIESIAVLPLENLSKDKEQEYFVSGIHEELLTDLAKIKSLKVISRTSMMKYVDTKKSTTEIAKELNVDAIVEGSVLRESNNVRINVQLIDGSTDNHLWAESYDRNDRNMLKMLSEVAEAIVGEIKTVVTKEEKDRIAAVYFIKPEAHEEYLKGRYLLFHGAPTRFPEAMMHFQRSVEIDPNFAPGYSGQAGVYYFLGYFGVKPPLEVIPNAKRMAIKALEIDDGIAEPHTILSWIKLSYDWDWPGAAKEALRALEMNPSDAAARHAYGDYLMFYRGDIEEGLHQLKLARDVDPYTPMSVMPSIYHLQLARRYDEIIDECRKLLEKDSNYTNARGNLRDALWLKGNYEQAYIEFQKTWNWNDELKAALRRGYKISGPKGAVRELASTFAKQSIPNTGSSLGVATLYAFVQDKDLTIAWLEKSYTEHALDLYNIKRSPTYDFLFTDPRFQSLLKRIGFSETEKEHSNE